MRSLELGRLVYQALVEYHGGKALPEIGEVGKRYNLTAKELDRPGLETWKVLADWYEEHGYQEKADIIRSGEAVITGRYVKWLGTCWTLESGQSDEPPKKTKVVFFYSPGDHVHYGLSPSEGK